MPYFIVHRTSDGEIVSESDDLANIANPLPAGLTTKDVGSRPNWATQIWNPATRDVYGYLNSPVNADRAIYTKLSASPLHGSIAGKQAIEASQHRVPDL